VEGETVTERTPALDVCADILAAGIPLTLLLDLAYAPNSAQIYAEEGGDANWLQPAVRRGA
jgi:hypothetical protein